MQPAWDVAADYWDSVATDMAAEPVEWVKSHGEHPWSKQREVLESVRDNRYTAVHSAHDLGKSFIASRIIAWWISTRPVGEAFVVSTAPTAAQVSAIMWREVTKIHRKANLIGKINRAGYPQWYADGELIGYGRKPADYEQSAFQGIHAMHVLVVIDEAGGVARHLYDAVDALATNDNARVLAIGNPDDPASHFAAICKPESGWNVIHLDGLRSPNMTRRLVEPFPLLKLLMEAEGVKPSKEKIPEDMRGYLVGPKWIEERIERWAGVSVQSLALLSHEERLDKVRSACNGSALFTAKVRGMFPEAGSEGIIPLGWIMRAVERWHDLADDKKQASFKATEAGRKIVGVDVARTGRDATSLAIRYGSYVPSIETARITDTMEVVAKVSGHLHEPGSIAVVDVIGIGSGVYDRLRQMRTHGEIVGQVLPFNASRASGRTDKLGQFQFFNDRAASWWRMRELLDPAFGSQLAIPDDDELIEELAAPKYELYANGKLKVESKDDIKRRIGRSTDKADALLMSYWADSGYSAEFVPYEDDAKQSRYPNGHRGRVIDYDGYRPFSEDDMSTRAGVGNLGSGATPIGPGHFGSGLGGDWSI